MYPLQLFIDRMAECKEPRILELGTKRSNPEVSTMHRNFVPHAKEFLGTDFQDGIDVDILADVHHLYRDISATGREPDFDGIISCSTFEHIARPWIAMQELHKCLKTEGVLFVQTHNCFPIHAFPNDYWRFTREALRLLAEDAGFHVLETAYEFPAVIHSDRDPNTAKITDSAYLNVLLCAEKI